MPVTFAAAHAATSSASQGEVVIETVTVTAEKHSQNLQDVAGSVLALSGADLMKESRLDLDTVLQQVPNVLVEGGPSGFLVSMRGVSEDQNPTTTDAPVTIFRDGVVDTSSFDAQAGFYDISRVEVLRGPQGTLYGHNAIGGAVNIISNDPILGETSGGITAEVGSYGLLHADGFANIALTDDLAARVAVSSLSHDGYMSDGANDADIKAGRLKLLYAPNKDLSVLLGAEYTRLGGAGNGDTVFTANGDLQSNPWKSGYIPFPPPCGFGPFPPCTVQPYPNDSFFRDTIEKYYARIDYDMGFGKLTLIPAFSKDRINESDYVTGLDNVFFITDQNESLEARLASRDGARISWILGLYVSDARDSTTIDSSTFAYSPPVTVATTLGASELDTTKFLDEAVFGQVTIPITERFKLTVGLRETLDKKHFDEHQTTLPPGGPQTIVPVQIVSADSSHFDYKVNAKYELSHTSMVYAQVETGYRGAGYANHSLKCVGAPPCTGSYIGKGESAGGSLTSTGQSTAGSRPYYEPEKLTEYEIGTKNRFFDGDLQLNGDAYFYDYSSYQASASSTTAPIFTITDTAKATVYGVELESALVLSDSDLFSVNAAYTHSTFGDFTDPANTAAYKGRPLSHAPEWTFGPSYEHVFQFPNGGRLTAEVDSKYTSSYYVIYTASNPSAAQPPWTNAAAIKRAGTQEAYWRTNLSLSYQSGGNVPWTLTAYARNLENVAVKDFWVGPPPYGYAFIEAPRTFGVIWSTKF